MGDTRRGSREVADGGTSAGLVACGWEAILRGMDEIEQFKNFLGPAGKGYTNAQIRQLRREMQAMAELLLDIYLYKKCGKGTGIKASLTEPTEGDTMDS